MNSLSFISNGEEKPIAQNEGIRRYALAGHFPSCRLMRRTWMEVVTLFSEAANRSA